MRNETSVSGGMIGLPGLLAVAFIVLKLCHVIDWSWWWVLAPLWIPAALVLIFVFFLIIVKVILAMKKF